MPEFMRLLSELREHMQAELTRSDVLRPLVWPILALILALAVLNGRVPSWVTNALSIALGAFIALYALIYIICFFVDRDALRSEKYKLQKMAIERGVYGDSEHGLMPAKEVRALANDTDEPVEPD